MDTGATSGGPQSTADLEPGTVVNGLYRLVRLLGVGGMGEVWEARQERTKGRVALKLLLPEMGRHEQVLHRFQREVEITSGLNHPNIVRVSDADKLPNGRPFLVMEYLDGHDLSQFLRNGRPPGLAETVEIVEQAAMGLHAAHGQSVIHRDLKPANIFVVPLPAKGRVLVKILDFGISKALDGLSQLTQSRSVIGTPHYMAPEQATGGASVVDARADQFSLAAIAYELLTGRMAFAGDGLVNVIFKVVREQPPSFSTLGLAMPPGIEAAVIRGLNKSPVDRFGSVLEFSDELRRAAGQVGADRGPRTAILPTSPRTLPLPDETARLAEPMSTTLRASTGEIAVVGRVGPNVEGAPRIGAARSPWRKPLAAVIGGAGLAGIILVVSTFLRGPLVTVGPPGPASAGPVVSVQTPPVSGGAVVPVAAPTPLSSGAVPDDLTLPARRGPLRVEHLTLPASMPERGVLERPGHSSVATPPPLRKKPNEKKPTATDKTVSDGQKAAPRAPKPSTKKGGGHPGPLNEDL